MADVEGKVCPNHPDVAAASRCVTCFKPICEACIIARQGNDFCSDICAAKHFATNQGVEDYKKRESSKKLKRLVRNVLILAIIVAAAVFGYKHYQKDKAGWDKKINSATDSIKEKTKDTKNAIDKTIKERNKDDINLDD